MFLVGDTVAECGSDGRADRGRDGRAGIGGSDGRRFVGRAERNRRRPGRQRDAGSGPDQRGRK